MSIDWGELRSLSARLLSTPKDLATIEALLPLTSSALRRCATSMITLSARLASI